MQTVNARGAIGTLFIVASLSQGCANTDRSGDEPLLAAAVSAPNSSYVLSGDSKIVKAADKKLCVRTSKWSAEDVYVECGDVAAEEPAAPGNVLVAYNGRALFEFDSSVLTGVGKVELDRLTAKLNTQDLSLIHI